MMFDVKAGALAGAILAAAASVRANKKIVALALSSVRLTAAGGRVTVACFDKTIAISASVAAEVERPGSVAVSAERMHALVDGFPAKAVITIDDRMAIVCGKSRYRLQPIPPADLPALPNAIDDQIADIEITAADCLALLEPLPAADTEGTHYYLGGVFWHSIGNELIGASTNGHTLIRVAVKVGKFFSDGRDLIVPMASAAVLRRLIRQTSPARVTLRRSKKLISIECAEFCLVSPLIGTMFPPYESVIPATSPHTFTCASADLTAAIARLTAASTTEGPLAALSWSEGGEFSISLARQPLDGADVIAGTACGDVKLAVPLRQLGELVGEMRCSRLRLEAGDGGGHLTFHDDAGKLALVTTSTWDFPTTTTTTMEKAI